MRDHIREVAEAVLRMDEQLRGGLLEKYEREREKADWGFRHSVQSDKLTGRQNTLTDHVRAMVYSLLSAGRRWERIEDSKAWLDEIFFGYDPGKLKRMSASHLEKEIRAIKGGNRRIGYQMRRLCANIEKLESFENEYGNIDEFYEKLNGGDELYKTLVSALSGLRFGGRYKLSELGIALVCEYLRNVGYSVPKPDRHILRILGSEYLSCSKHGRARELEVFDIISKVSQVAGKPVAEVDYILWSYCASDYGAVCTQVNPRCGVCVARSLCAKQCDGAK